MAKRTAMKRPTSTSKRPQTKSKAVRGMKGRRSQRSFMFGIVFAVLFGIIGSYFLFTSKAAVIDRGTTVAMQSADGCWLAGRVWDGNSCTTKCRNSSTNYIAKTTSHLGYCSGAIATGVGQSSCTELARRYVNGTGCARRIDQETTVNARQCRFSNNTYYNRTDKPDFCGLECSGVRYIGITSCPTTSTTTFSIWDRDMVNNSYKSLWASGVSVQQSWTGSVSSCSPGNISDAARRAQINGINFARQVNGLRLLTGNYNAASTVNLDAQKAALMMDANGQLSHSPPSSWKCYTSAGAAAAGASNIGLNSGPITPLAMLKTFFDDPGAANYYVGHRRWLLNPDANAFGFGMTGRAAAITVIGTSSDTTNPDPLWTMWPSRGYFPSTLEPNGRWSASAKAGINLAYANVSVTKNGAAVPITKEPVNNGDARSTLVWEMPAGSNNGNYSVTVSGARKDGVTQPTYNYSIYFFAPY